MRKLSLLLIIIGFVIIGYSIFQISQNNMKQKSALVEAKNAIQLDDNKESTINTSNKLIKPTIDDFFPEKGDKVGILEIDKIKAELPIIEGTHEDELAQGVGHLEDTVYPSQDDQILLSGHRDTVFMRMGELEIGDIMTVRMPYGNFDYEIVNTKIVEADDLTVIVPHDEETLTVTTCYPFNYVGHAPDRYIVDAKPVVD